MRQFYGRLEKCVLSAGKTHVHKIPRLGGDILGFFFGGGTADFIFMGARIFLIKRGPKAFRYASVFKTRAFRNASVSVFKTRVSPI